MESSTARVITASSIFDGKSLLANSAIIISEGIITDIIDINKVPPSISIEDYGDVILSAPFMDLQINGWNLRSHLK